MATGKNITLSREQTNFIRGVQTIEVSINALWEFVSSEVPLKEFLQSWKIKTRGAQPSGRNAWIIRAIRDVSPKKWDISVLCHAILESDKLELDETQKKSVKQLRNVRNEKLFHTRMEQFGFEEYVEVLRESMDGYKGLLDEAKRLIYVKQLNDMNNGRIRDEETESWLKELQSIDAAMEEKEDQLVEEDIVTICRGISDLASSKYAALEKRVKDLEQAVQQNQAQMQATGAVRSDSNDYREASKSVLEKKPDMAQLTLLEWTENGSAKEFRLINQIATRWEDLGLAGLGMKQYEIDEAGSGRNDSSRCRKLLMRFLQNGSPKFETPTWANLIEAMKKAGLKDEAKSLQRALLQCNN